MSNAGKAVGPGATKPNPTTAIKKVRDEFLYTTSNILLLTLYAGAVFYMLTAGDFFTAMKQVGIGLDSQSLQSFATSKITSYSLSTYFEVGAFILALAALGAKVGPKLSKEFPELTILRAILLLASIFLFLVPGIAFLFSGLIS